jgi:hypothetical protein
MEDPTASVDVGGIRTSPNLVAARERRAVTLSSQAGRTYFQVTPNAAPLVTAAHR